MRSTESPVALPFSGGVGVFHFTQLVDSSNPGQTSIFTRTARREFIIDDGTGHARVPCQVSIEFMQPELPDGQGIDRNDPAVPEFLGRDEDKLFSKGGAVIWRQQSIRVGDEVLAWGRVVLEPDTNPRDYQVHLREQALRVVLAPLEPNGALVIESNRAGDHGRPSRATRCVGS